MDRIAASKLGWYERVVLAQDELPCTTEDSLVQEIVKKGIDRIAVVLTYLHLSHLNNCYIFSLIVYT